LDIDGQAMVKRHRVSASRQEVVARAEAYVRAHLDSPIALSHLCRIVGVSERGLRNAFYGVHGVAPKRWMQAERLIRVQNALSEPRGRATTVTEAAADHGFYQLGRFSAMYKQTFGEAPSETLRAASRGRSTMEQQRGHTDALTR
jgi:AraC family ethanolamine operon transcriptional activator